MYKVYGTRTNRGNRSFRVIWALEELGFDYKVVDTAPRSDAMFAVNPLGQAPSMQDGDHTLTDSLAILHYLTGKTGTLTHPQGTPARALVDARINFVLTEIEAPIWLLARHAFVLPEKDRAPGMRPIVEAEIARSEKRFAMLLAGNPYFAGDTFTIADVVAGHCLHWAESANIPLQSETVQSYLSSMRARPAWSRALGKDTA
ncbi:glutathione S-transferase family protein [Rhodobacteraceae bacterium]|nr:glutathione S-transferase family protein [Paracoccaceae bacterium]